MQNNSNKELKNFGLIWAGIFLIIAFLPLLKGHEVKIWAPYTSLAFIAISLIYPKIYQQIYFYQGWIKFGNFIGKINSKIIITVLFYVIFLPIGIILKILRKDLLHKKIDKSSTSYFIDRKIQPQNMKNQF